MTSSMITPVIVKREQKRRCKGTRAAFAGFSILGPTCSAQFYVCLKLRRNITYHVFLQINQLRPERVKTQNCTVQVIYKTEDGKLLVTCCQTGAILWSYTDGQYYSGHQTPIAEYNVKILSIKKILYISSLFFIQSHFCDVTLIHKYPQIQPIADDLHSLIMKL